MGVQHSDCQISVTFEPPDTVILVLSGEVQAEHAQQIADEMERLVSGKPYFVELFNISSLTGVSLEARKIADRSADRMTNRRGIAFVGGGNVIRVVVSFMSRRFAVFNRPNERDPIRFFETEAEARAWLLGRRAAVRDEMKIDGPDVAGRRP